MLYLLANKTSVINLLHNTPPKHKADLKTPVLEKLLEDEPRGKSTVASWKSWKSKFLFLTKLLKENLMIQHNFLLKLTKKKAWVFFNVLGYFRSLQYEKEGTPGKEKLERKAACKNNLSYLLLALTVADRLEWSSGKGDGYKKVKSV